jgi:hypothetical protein
VQVLYIELRTCVPLSHSWLYATGAWQFSAAWLIHWQMFWHT